jgi:hypothetical protein
MPSPFQFLRKVLRLLGATPSRLKIVIVCALCLVPAASYSTVSVVASSVTAQGNNVTTIFNFSFPMVGPQYARVQIVNGTVTPNTITTLSSTQYTLTGATNPTGGTVTYPLSGSPLAPGYYIVIQRVVPLIQTTSIANQGPTFRAIENALDYLTYITQQLQTQISVLQTQVAGGGGLIPPTYTGRVIASGVTDNAFTTDTTIAWASATGGAKTEFLYECSTDNFWKVLTITDQSGTFGTYPLTITPFGSNTINGASSYIMPFNHQSTVLQCTPSSDWIAQ